jgi:hypothetical protein
MTSPASAKRLPQAVLLATILAALALMAHSAQAKVIVDPSTHKAFGIVPTGHTAAPRAHRLAAARTSQCATDCSPLLYGNPPGPVQHAEHDYLFFWDPSGSFPAAYKAGLAQLLNDLGRAGPMNATPISVSQQYYENSGPGGAPNFVKFDVHNEGSIVDSSPYPHGCSLTGYSVCITDQQIEDELSHYISSHGLPTGTDVEYFVFTPQGVASCIDSNPADGCSYSDYCGYHSNFQQSAGAQQIIYADMPWTYGFPGCDNGPPYPNSNQIDSVVDTFSHELTESMTDPVAGSGWVDASGNEIADKCAGLYGNTQAASNGAAYNVQLGSDLYLVQTEFSNLTGNCESTLPIPVNTALPAISGQARQGSSLVEVAGTWSNNPTAVSYQWESCDSAGANCVAIPGATAKSYQVGAGDVGHTLRVVEVATNSVGTGAPAASAPTQAVPPSPPANTRAPAISGKATETSTLTVAAAGWSNNPTAILDQWARCDANGGNCSAIAGATGQQYQLRSGDIDHTIRVFEIASNAGGQGPLVGSAASGLVGPSQARVSSQLRSLAGDAPRARLSELLGRTRTTYRFTSPSAGQLTITERSAGAVIGRGAVTLRQAQLGLVTVTLTRQGRALARGRYRNLAVQLIISFRPAAGGVATLRRTVRL